MQSDRRPTRKAVTSMIAFQVDRVINRPIEEVFDRLADINGYGDWMSRDGLFRDSQQVSDGPIEVGTEFYDRSSLGELRGEVTEFEQPRRLGFRQVLHRNDSPIFESRPSYVLEQTGEGTAVHHHAEAEFRGIYKVLEPVAYFVARRERKRVLDSLESSLTGPSAAPGR
jgi:uncharacterized protein YndB with AHSA1/START domain